MYSQSVCCIVYTFKRTIILLCFFPICRSRRYILTLQIQFLFRYILHPDKTYKIYILNFYIYRYTINAIVQFALSVLNITYVHYILYIILIQYGIILFYFTPNTYTIFGQLLQNMGSGYLLFELALNARRTYNVTNNFNRFQLHNEKTT